MWFWVFIVVVVVLLLAIFLGGYRKGTKVGSPEVTGTGVTSISLADNGPVDRPAA
ncbi:MAG TPA: hypothetical protein VFW65_27800 [Pseudonocardiaceae bacterium]|nr:hypothetical protein [Pseudonocardiaceae bacterium]